MKFGFIGILSPESRVSTCSVSIQDERAKYRPISCVRSPGTTSPSGAAKREGHGAGVVCRQQTMKRVTAKKRYAEGTSWSGPASRQSSGAFCRNDLEGGAQRRQRFRLLRSRTGSIFDRTRSIGIGRFAVRLPVGLGVDGVCAPSYARSGSLPPDTARFLCVGDPQLEQLSRLTRGLIQRR